MSVTEKLKQTLHRLTLNTFNSKQKFLEVTSITPLGLSLTASFH